MTDEQFIQGIRDDAHAAFDFIYKKYYWQYVYFAQHLSCTHEDARDIVSEAFSKIWIKRKKLKSLQHAENFLYKLVRESIVDLQRKKEIKSKVEGSLKSKARISENIIERKYQEAQLTRLLMEKVNQLPERMQLIFKLTYLEGMSRTEVAEKLNISENTVRNTNQNTMKALRLAFGINDNDKTAIVIFAGLILLTLY